MRCVLVLSFGPSDDRTALTVALSTAVARAGRFAVALDLASTSDFDSLTERLYGAAHPGPGALDVLSVPSDPPAVSFLDAGPTRGVGPFPGDGRLWVSPAGDSTVRLPPRPALDHVVSHLVGDVALLLKPDVAVIDGPYAHSALAIASATRVADEIVVVTRGATDDLDDARGVVDRLTAELARAQTRPRLHVAVLVGSDQDAPDFAGARVHLIGDELGPLVRDVFGDLVAADEAATAVEVDEHRADDGAGALRGRVVALLERSNELTARQDYRPALPVVVEALELARGLPDTHVDRIVLTRALVAHADAMCRTHNFDAAALTAIEARAVGDQLIREDDTQLGLRADAEDVMAEVYRLNQQPEGIVYSYEQAVDFRRRAGTADTPSQTALARSLRGLGATLTTMGYPERGLPLVQESAELLRDPAGDALHRGAEYAATLTELGETLAAVGDEDAADTLDDAAILLHELVELDRNHSPLFARALLSHATELRVRDLPELAHRRATDAERLYRWLRENVDGYEWHHARALAESARILAALDRTAEALGPAAEAVRALEHTIEVTGMGTYTLIDVETDLSGYCSRLGRIEAARRHAQRAEEWRGRLPESELVEATDQHA